jgi:anti-sigma-K factor RskA
MNQDPHDLVAAYALDALDDEERERFERHLAECERCSAQLLELGGAAGALAYAAEGPEPRRALRGRILESARAGGGAKVISFPLRRWALPAVAAAAACLAIGLGIWATSLSRSLDRERAALARARVDQQSDAAAITTFLQRDRQQIPLSGSHIRGILSVTSFRDGVLVACDISAPKGKTFEAWVISGKVPRPAGLFTGGDGMCTSLLLKERLPNGATVAVTLEPKGGSDKPTTPILFKAQAA